MNDQRYGPLKKRRQGHINTLTVLPRKGHRTEEHGILGGRAHYILSALKEYEWCHHTKIIRGIRAEEGEKRFKYICIHTLQLVGFKKKCF